MIRSTALSVAVSALLLVALFALYFLAGPIVGGVGAATVLAGGIALAVVTLYREPVAGTSMLVTDFLAIFCVHTGAIFLAVLLADAFDTFWVAGLSVGALLLILKLYIDRRVGR